MISMLQKYAFFLVPPTVFPIFFDYALLFITI